MSRIGRSRSIWMLFVIGVGLLLVFSRDGGFEGAACDIEMSASKGVVSGWFTSRSSLPCSCGPVKTAAKRHADDEKAERGMKPTPAFLKREQAEGEDTATYNRSTKAPAKKSASKAPAKSSSRW